MPILGSQNKYKISVDELNYLNPEETLSDVSGIQQPLEKPVSSFSFKFFVGAVVAILIFYLANLFRLQVFNGKDFLAIINSANAGRYFNVPVRGIIYDRNKESLVENIPRFSLIALSSELSKEDIQTRESHFHSISTIIGIGADSISELYQTNKKNMTFLVKQGLPKEEVLALNGAKIPGFYVIYDAARHYIQSNYSAHLIGYTSKVSLEDIRKDTYYNLNDKIGKYGLEAQYEPFLRGEKRALALDADQSFTDNANPGNDLYLNIDKKIQAKLYESLVAMGVRRGAAIAQNPQTGAVLGIVSMPSFDNNDFENGNSENIQRVLENKQRPLFNRVVSGKYSSGSTIKPLLALAGLNEGVVTPETAIFSEGFISIPSVFDSSVVYTFKDWKVHGWSDLRKAISDSVDVYFYTLGGGYGPIKGLGVERIIKYFKQFLLDKPTGIDLLGEASGFIPSPEWKQKTQGGQWFVGDTYNISIGQGDLLVTPVWLNMYLGAIANGGKLMKPYIVQKIIDPDGNLVKENQPQVFGEVSFKPGVLDVVRQGMRQTVTSGTATMLNNLPIQVAAKTGTAQVAGHGLNSLFIVYGPYEKPEIALTVLVEDINNNQGLAIRVANNFLSWYFAPTDKNNVDN